MKTAFTFRNAFAAAALAAITCVAPANAADSKDDSAAAKPVAKSIAKAAAVSKVRPLSVTADLLGSTKLTGTLMDTTALEMRTSFGIASIPLSEVAGIRFASAENATTTVVMLNGDSITGATDVKLVTIETEWGTAAINGQNIAAIMFVPGLTWSSHTGLNGKRWILANNKSGANSAASKAPAKPTSRAAVKTPVRSTSSPVVYPPTRNFSN